MAYTVTPQTSIIESHNLQGLKSCHHQADLSCGTSHHSRVRALIPFSCPVKCNEKTRSHLRQNEIYGSGVTASLLECRGKQASICLDGVG